MKVPGERNVRMYAGSLDLQISTSNYYKRQHRDSNKVEKRLKICNCQSVGNYVSKEQTTVKIIETCTTDSVDCEIIIRHNNEGRRRNITVEYRDDGKYRQVSTRPYIYQTTKTNQQIKTADNPQQQHQQQQQKQKLQQYQQCAEKCSYNRTTANVDVQNTEKNKMHNTTPRASNKLQPLQGTRKSEDFLYFLNKLYKECNFTNCKAK